MSPSHGEQRTERKRMKLFNFVFEQWVCALASRIPTAVDRPERKTMAGTLSGIELNYQLSNTLELFRCAQKLAGTMYPRTTGFACNAVASFSHQPRIHSYSAVIIHTHTHSDGRAFIKQYSPYFWCVCHTYSAVRRTRPGYSALLILDTRKTEHSYTGRSRNGMHATYI